MPLTWNLYDEIGEGSHLDSYVSTNILTFQILVRNKKKNVILKTKFFPSRENIVDELHYAIVLAGNLTEGENQEWHNDNSINSKRLNYVKNRFKKA